MRCAIAAVLLTVVTGCVPSAVLRDRAIEQNVTVEDVTDSILVANILRARDQAPLQFADIPLMHESFQISAGITPTILFGPIHAGSGSHTVAPTASVQEAPTFDLSNLDTQDFVTGIMSPIKPNIIKYWLDRGLDDRLALLLFFSSVTVSVGKGDNAPPPIIILNDPRNALATKIAGQRGFRSYLSVIDQLSGNFKVVEAPNLTPVGPPFVLNMDKHLKELSKVDSSKYEVDPLEPNPDKTKRKTQPYVLVEQPDEGTIYKIYQLFSAADSKILICFNTSRVSGRSPLQQKLCKQGGGPAAGVKSAIKLPECPMPQDFFVRNDCSATLTFAVRSAGDVIHFLGDLLWLQDHNIPGSAALHNPITLGNCKAIPAPDCADILFDIPRAAEGSPGRLRVPYRNEFYMIPNGTPTDHTLEALAITAQLINLNKSAKELRATPTVQVIP
jgi:hypothetical protein